MKKKLTTFITTKVCGGKMPMVTDGEYYYYNDGHKLFRTKEKLLPIPAEKSFAITSWFKDIDATRYDLPDAEEINDNIKELCGRKLDNVGVKFSEETPILNARWVRDAMKALNTKGMYYIPQKGKISPVYMFENDDLQSENILMILPINNHQNVGYKIYA